MSQNQKNKKNESQKTKYKINIDSSNTKSLIKFFEDHDDYKTHEIACKYSIPISTVRYWKQKVGIKSQESSLTKLKTRYKAKEYEKVTDPEIWDNPEWFKKMYEENGYGAVIISKIIEKSRSTVYNRLIRYEIKIRNVDEAKKSKNVLCNKEWLIENYLKKHIPKYKLAKIAGVSEYTISNWLIKFGILPRGPAQAAVVSNTGKRVKRYRSKWNKPSDD